MKWQWILYICNPSLSAAFSVLVVRAKSKNAHATTTHKTMVGSVSSIHLLQAFSPYSVTCDRFIYIWHVLVLLLLDDNYLTTLRQLLTFDGVLRSLLRSSSRSYFRASCITYDISGGWKERRSFGQSSCSVDPWIISIRGSNFHHSFVNFDFTRYLISSCSTTNQGAADHLPFPSIAGDGMYV